ncbi:SGNH/GDSL hydrolase family protein [Clostridium sp. CX1]|uniref:SGNH/GDSL hydrolase family protein n=1 Tax=Clostridium sp. CX1 TaxID=2978346 RepID=UPI0021BEF203|nr:SGNH/GDSL hydrolase family protein [Clostridium sp. CX1]MCT8977069.1 SGNH/GDSL hydrolase family protein [Clostridium sp. CX1]
MKKKFKLPLWGTLVIILILSLFNIYSKLSTYWIGAWNGTAVDLTFFRLGYKNQSLRTVVTSTFGGSKERIKISNEFGREPIHIGEASFALVNPQGILYKNSQRELTFNGKSTITIEKGAFVWSDPVEVPIKTLDRVAVTIYFPDEVKNVTGAWGGGESYFSQKGNFTKSMDTKRDFKPVSTNGIPKIAPFLTSIEVRTSRENRSIVAFGDSITTLSWPDYLVKKLKNRNVENLSVVREAIGGNRILHDTENQLQGVFGPSGISRFEKAITDHKGVKYVIVLQGVNDIMHPAPGGPAPASEIVSKDEIVSALEKYTELAHKYNLKIYGGTIMPFEGYEVYTDDLDVKRREVNEWIRTSGKFDGIIDFDKAMADPNNPSRLLPKYDSGDHLHPSDAGGEAMAEAIDLKLFYTD